VGDGDGSTEDVVSVGRKVGSFVGHDVGLSEGDTVGGKVGGKTLAVVGGEVFVVVGNCNNFLVTWCLETEGHIDGGFKGSKKIDDISLSISVSDSTEVYSCIC